MILEIQELFREAKPKTLHLKKWSSGGWNIWRLKRITSFLLFQRDKEVCRIINKYIIGWVIRIIFKIVLRLSHSFNEYLLSTYYMLGIVLDAENKDQDFALYHLQ